MKTIERLLSCASHSTALTVAALLLVVPNDSMFDGVICSFILQFVAFAIPLCILFTANDAVVKENSREAINLQLTLWLVVALWIGAFLLYLGAGELMGAGSVAVPRIEDLARPDFANIASDYVSRLWRLGVFEFVVLLNASLILLLSACGAILYGLVAPLVAVCLVLTSGRSFRYPLVVRFFRVPLAGVRASLS